MPGLGGVSALRHKAAQRPVTSALCHMKDCRLFVGPAANGFTCINTFSHFRSLKLGLLLLFRYGFWRKGGWVRAVTDNAIYASFVHGRKSILTG